MDEKYELKRAIILFGVLMRSMEADGIETGVTTLEKKKFRQLIKDLWGISDDLTAKPKVKVELEQLVIDLLNELKSQVFNSGR